MVARSFSSLRLINRTNCAVIAFADNSKTLQGGTLCELPILKYIFGTTTKNSEVTRCIVTARAVPVVYNENMQPGTVAEFDQICKK